MRFEQQTDDKPQPAVRNTQRPSTFRFAAHTSESPSGKPGETNILLKIICGCTRISSTKPIQTKPNQPSPNPHPSCKKSLERELASTARARLQREAGHNRATYRSTHAYGDIYIFMPDETKPTHAHHTQAQIGVTSTTPPGLAPRVEKAKQEKNIFWHVPCQHQDSTQGTAVFLDCCCAVLCHLNLGEGKTFQEFTLRGPRHRKQTEECMSNVPRG